MGQYYQDIDKLYFDYDLQDCGALPGRKLRGPVPDLSKPYAVCIGAAQTFGRFCERPFPTILSETLGLPVLNLGFAGSGPRAFLDPALLDIINRAEVAVVQVLSGRSESNSAFDNGSSGGTHGIRLRDLKSMRFEEFLEQEFAAGRAGQLVPLIQETRENWVNNYVRLLRSIAVPKVLHWFSSRTPRRTDDYSSCWRLLGVFPQLVTEDMVERVKPLADVYVETVSKEGLPQGLWRHDAAIDGAECVEGRLFNTYYPSPEMHRTAAEDLAPACLRFAGRPGQAEAGSTPARFLLLCAERTGSNLLAGMLDDHPSVHMGGELFNRFADHIQWRFAEASRDPALLGLRKERPQDMLELFFAQESAVGKTAGFKVMYGHLEDNPDLAAFARNTGVRILHLRRRNWVERFVSHRRAELTGVWAADTREKRPAQPAVRLGAAELFNDVFYTMSNELRVASQWRGHDILEVFYEDLERNPERVAARVFRFLGVPEVEVGVRFKKLAAGGLRASLENFGELREVFQRITRCFDEV